MNNHFLVGVAFFLARRKMFFSDTKNFCGRILHFRGVIHFFPAGKDRPSAKVLFLLSRIAHPSVRIVAFRLRGYCWILTLLIFRGRIVNFRGVIYFFCGRILHFCGVIHFSLTGNDHPSAKVLFLLSRKVYLPIRIVVFRLRIYSWILTLMVFP